MSKTYRRKGYEKTLGNSWHRRGWKAAGAYTETDATKHEGKSRWGGFVYKYFITYRAPTEAEYVERNRIYHGESKHRNARSPSRGYRHDRMVENRNINKRELDKWNKYPDEYEPMFEANSRSCWWDWD